MRRYDAFEVRKSSPLGDALSKGAYEFAVLAWGVRVELAVYGLVGLGTYAGLAFGLWPGVPFLLAELVALWRWRGLLHRVLHRSGVRRQWARAVVDAGAADPPSRTSRRAHESRGPRVARVCEVPAGDLIHIRAARGSSVTQIVKYADRIGANLDAVLEITPDATSERRAVVLVRRCDPFSGRAAIPWPNLDITEVQLWGPIPLGIDENGSQVDLQLANDKGARSLLIGGETGSGKSVATSLILSTIVRASDVRHRWLADGTELDTVVWEHAVDKYVGADRAAFVAMLKDVHAAMEETKTTLTAKGQRKVHPGDPLDVLVVDELPFYLNAPAGRDKASTEQQALAKQARELLRDLIARGRKFGIVVVAIAQKPDADVIPTYFRDLLSYRLAFRCKTREAARMILGEVADEGWNPTQIREDQLGVGILDATGARPVRIKTYHLSDAEIERIAASCATVSPRTR